jgi:hypothetical protein
MKISNEIITPEIAKKLLEKNTENRHLRQSHVRDLANEMTSGRWRVTAQGISLTADNQVVDGQHRLHAVVKSGVSVMFVVARGIPKEDMEVYDIGAKRTVSDTLALRDGLTDSNVTTAAARQIMSLCFGYQNYTLSIGTVRGVLAEFGPEITTANALLRSFKPARKSWVVGATAFALKSNRRIEDFAEILGSGENTEKGCPAFAVRNWLINQSAQVLKQTYKAGAYECIFNAMFAFIKGGKMTQIKRGLTGIVHFKAKQKSFIESYREEMLRLQH